MAPSCAFGTRTYSYVRLDKRLEAKKKLAKKTEQWFGDVFKTLTRCLIAEPMNHNRAPQSERHVFRGCIPWLFVCFREQESCAGEIQPQVPWLE